jgi:hypothetical protein
VRWRNRIGRIEMTVRLQRCLGLFAISGGSHSTQPKTTTASLTHSAPKFSTDLGVRLYVTGRYEQRPWIGSVCAGRQ